MQKLFPLHARAEYFLFPVWSFTRVENRFLVCMQNLFACSVSSFLPLPRAQIFFFFLALHDDMRVENLLFGQQQGCACRNFFYFFLFLSGHFSSAVCAAFLFL
jgi:hypothetical protein